jgi:hypothetical protein
MYSSTSFNVICTCRNISLWEIELEGVGGGGGRGFLGLTS